MSPPGAPSPEVDAERFWALHRLALAASETPRTAEGVRRIEAATKALQEPAEELVRAMAAGPKRSHTHEPAQEPAEEAPRVTKPETTEGPMLPRAPRPAGSERRPDPYAPRVRLG